MHLVALIASAVAASAHGGIAPAPPPPSYGGPGDAGPSSPPPSGPSPGSSAPSAPAGPSTPGPIGPSTPGAPGPGGPGPTTAGGPTTGGGLQPDHTAWTLWWHFNKEPYLGLKAHVRAGGPRTSDGFFLGHGKADESAPPSEERIRGSVVPALLETLAESKNKDIVTSCLVALAKIGDGGEGETEPPLAAVLQRYLASKNQEIAETAAVSLGILADPGSIETLAALLLDTEAGRALVGQREVSNRTRAFAAYGLGLVGALRPGEIASERIVVILHQALSLARTASADLKVACIHAMGLVPLEGRARLAQLDALLGVLQEQMLDPLVRAHCPAALARLFAGMHEERREAYRHLIAEELMRLASSPRAPAPLVQGSVQALGLIGTNDGENELDRRIRKTLRESFRDQPAQRFALIALAKVGARAGQAQPDVGAREAATALLEHLSRARNDLGAWAGLACGILARGLEDGGHALPVIASLKRAVRQALVDERDPFLRGAHAIACGIMRAEEAAPELLALLERERGDDVRGHVAIALAMVGSKEALTPLRTIVEESRYRPELLKHTAIALALLEDASAVPKLVGLLGAARSLATQASISSALGFIGDERSLAPLVEMLRNEDLTERARAFAAVALGIVADKELLPWNAKLSQDVDYCAAPPTLTDPASGAGILDIL